MGHASIAITKEVYGDPVDGEKTKAIETITCALFGEDGSQGPAEADPPVHGTEA